MSLKQLRRRRRKRGKKPDGDERAERKDTAVYFNLIEPLIAVTFRTPCDEKVRSPHIY